MEFYVNGWAIAAATLAAMVLGSLWYGPLFGKRWMKLNNFTSDDIRNAGPVWKTFAISAGTYLIASFGLSMFLGKEPSVLFGCFAGFAAAFFWIGTSKLNVSAYEMSSKKLWLLHFGFDILVYTVMGIIIAAIQ